MNTFHIDATIIDRSTRQIAKTSGSIPDTKSFILAPKNQNSKEGKARRMVGFAQLGYL